jgi:hypothetical protein
MGMSSDVLRELRGKGGQGGTFGNEELKEDEKKEDEVDRVGICE